MLLLAFAGDAGEDRLATSVTQTGRFSSQLQVLEVHGKHFTSTKLKQGITSFSTVLKQVSGLMVPVYAKGCGFLGSGGTF